MKTANERIEAFQNRMINAIERDEMFSLLGWADCELVELLASATLQGAEIAKAAIIEEQTHRK